MAYDRFIIAPFNSGLQTDLRPWLIPEDAFAELNNALVFRGRIIKRFGERLMGYGYTVPYMAPLFSRLSIALPGGSRVGTTDAMGNASGTVPGAIFKVGQAFSIANEIFTVYQLGTPAAMLDTGAATLATYNTTTGAYVITGATPATQVYFYPGEPVMGIWIYESGPINTQPTYVWDTQFVYTFNGFWSQASLVPIWHGTNLNFFWATTWQGITPNVLVLFVTNFNATIPAPAATDDPMWYFNGTNWVNFSVLTIFLTAGNYVQTARIILPFKNRLILLNTIEQTVDHATNTAYVNRCRYSHNGSPLATNAWLEPNQTTGGTFADGAGFIDAPTEEQIIGAEFIKDRLIVFFERSTWELAYTGNQILPFVWQKINTELGSESQFSSVPFDKEILAIGNVGVHACNGANVSRIDNKIPDFIFSILDKNTGPQRVWGIRDYFMETVYWTMPYIFQNELTNTPYPTKVLVYNYRNQTWAVNDDCITAFGYFEQLEADGSAFTWADCNFQWQNADFTWGSGDLEVDFRQVIAGNQEGYVFIIDPKFSRNASVLQITNLTIAAGIITLTIIDHTLVPVDDEGSNYILIENVQGTMGINGLIFPIYQLVNNNQLTIKIPVGTIINGMYTGGGTVTRVSNIGIQSKQWNPYVEKSRDVYVAKIDFGVLNTPDGQITIDYFASASYLSMVNEAIQTNTIMGTSVLETGPYNALIYPFELTQTTLWHQIYFQTEGAFIQIYMYMSPAQITNPTIALAPFELQGMVLSTMPTTSRLQ